jgi:ribosomal protein S18 acetylase RimI-like enzyme
VLEFSEGLVTVPIARLGNLAIAQELFEPICRLYDQVFSEPPFHWEPEESEQHRQRLTRIISSPGFGLSVATDGGDVAGFAYGYPLTATTRWWDGFVEPVAEELSREWVGRTFAVIDLGVRRDLRGNGLGRGLLTTLLESRREERATLAVQPETESAHAFYRHLGWHSVGRVVGVAGESAPFFDIYCRSLRDHDCGE